MVKSILIGFGYLNGSKLAGSSLTGTVSDLFRMYQFCHPWNRVILTDIDRRDASLEDDIATSVARGEIDRTFLDFPRNVSRYIIRNRHDFLTKLREELSSDDHIVLYYSGHGLDKVLIMPDDSVVSFDEILDAIKKSVVVEFQVLIIFDCCFPSNLGLPFKLIDGKFQMVQRNFLVHDLILINSCREDQKAIGHLSGSAFTREFLANNMDGNINRIIRGIETRIEKATGHYQQAVVYSSLPRVPVFWSWFSRTQLDYVPGCEYIVMS